jgi:hypothetical protein
MNSEWWQPFAEALKHPPDVDAPPKLLLCESITPLSQMNGHAPPVIIEGLWRQQEVLLLGGHSKSWKSWALMDLMFCIANSMPWLVWSKTFGGNVLHIDLELFPAAIRERYADIQASYGQGSLDNIDVLSLRGVNFQLADFSELADQIQTGKYCAISLDPTYRMLGGSRMSESDTGTVIELMNRALQFASKLGSGVDLLQHFSKGSQSDKRALEAFSGTGVWGRAPDACLAFREHDDEKCYTINADLRHWPPVEPFVVHFDYPRFHIATEKDPENLKRPKPGRPLAFSTENLCNLIEDDEYISYASLMRRATAAGVKKPTFDRRLRDAKTLGWIALRVGDASYFLTSPYLARFRPNLVSVSE